MKKMKNIEKEERDLKEVYEENIIKTLDDIKNNIDCIIGDMHEKSIQNITIKIKIEPGTLVAWDLEKKYNVFEIEDGQQKLFGYTKK